MKNIKIQLPSNKSFGYFFSLIFLSSSFYFIIFNNNKKLGYFFLLITIIIFVVTFFKADKLQPLNKLWMHFGYILSIIMTPLIMGIIFFGLFMPFGLFMKLFGRDELRLKKSKYNSNWIIRSNKLPQTNFKNQF
jgi:hypothetical protein